MKRMHARLANLLMLAVWGCGTATFGQPTAAVCTAEAQAQSVPGARAVLDRARAEYKSAKTYQDKTVVHFKYESEGQGVGRVPDITFDLKVARPSSFSLRGSDFVVVGDGKTLTVAAARAKRYSQAALPAQLSLESVARDVPATLGFQLTFDAMFRDAGEEACPFVFRGVRSIGDVREEARAGEPGKSVLATMQLEDFPTEEDLPATLWFSDRTGLLGGATVDLTAMFAKMRDEAIAGARSNEDRETASKMPLLKKAIVEVSIVAPSVNGELAESQFAYVPDPSMKRVEAMNFDCDVQRQELVGKPAPAVEAIGMDGQTVNLSQMKGRVVVLEFWASWCGPCHQALPQMERMLERFDGGEVAMIGVCRDAPGSEPRLQRWLGQKGIKSQQILDAEQNIGKAFRTSRVPCVVLIDAKGVIQRIKVGYTSGEADRLGADISNLLAGNDLVEPAQIGAR